MGIVRGQRTSRGSNEVLQAQRVEDFASEITNPEAGFRNDMSALMTLTTNINKKREVKNPKYQVLEDVFRPREGTVAAAGWTKNQTSAVAVDSPFGDYCAVGSVLYIPSTGERVLVTARNSATSLDVTRNLGGLAGGGITGTDGTAEGQGIALASGAVIVRVYDNYGEGTSAPDAITVNAENSYNYTTIVKTTVDLSGTLIASELYGEQDEPYQIKKKGIEHKVDINRALWFGIRKEETTGANVRRFSAGVFAHLKGNSTALGTGILTAKALDAWAEKVFENGSDVKYIFGGMRMASALDNIGRNNVQVVNGASSFGTKMKEFVTNKGTFRFVRENKIFYGDLESKAVCLDLAYLKYVYLRGRDTVLKKNIKSLDGYDGYDGVKHLWQTEFGLDMKGYGLDHSLAASTGSQRSVHGIMTNILSY